MSLKSFCSGSVVTIERHASVEDAARLMRSRHVGDVVVVDLENTRKPVGIFTDRDLAVEVVALGMAPPTTPVGLVMSSPLLVLREEDSLTAALDRMSAHGVRRAPVVDAEGRLKGLVSVDDLVPLLARELARIGALMRRGQGEEIVRIDSPEENE